MNKDFILYIVILLLERMVLKREQFIEEVEEVLKDEEKCK
jgi:hypothetical protein